MHNSKLLYLSYILLDVLVYNKLHSYTSDTEHAWPYGSQVYLEAILGTHQRTYSSLLEHTHNAELLQVGLLTIGTVPAANRAGQEHHGLVRQWPWAHLQGCFLDGGSPGQLQCRLPHQRVIHRQRCRCSLAGNAPGVPGKVQRARVIVVKLQGHLLHLCQS